MTNKYIRIIKKASLTDEEKHYNNCQRARNKPTFISISLGRNANKGLSIPADRVWRHSENDLLRLPL